MRLPKLSGFARRLRIQDQARGRVIPKWTPWLLISCTVLLIPWTILLLVTLPEKTIARHWDVAWAGFDVGIGIALAATAATVLKRSVWTTVTASMTATLLIVDAWFDVLTSKDADERMIAIGMAIFCELPLAAICLWIARNVEHVLEEARRYVIAAGYRVEGRSLVPPDPPVAEAVPLASAETP